MVQWKVYKIVLKFDAVEIHSNKPHSWKKIYSQEKLSGEDVIYFLMACSFSVYVLLLYFLASK